MPNPSRCHALQLCIVIAWLMASACGDSPLEPAPPSSPPSIACPSAQSAISPSGDPVTLDFAAPGTSGGAAPVVVTCVPASGSRFPVGTTPVSCAARDAQQRVASCGFAVSVTKAPQLGATRFVAFGDSITAGVLGTTCPIGGGVSCTAGASLSGLRAHDFLGRPDTIGEESTAAYPRALQVMLTNRYPGQTITIANEGNPGEFASDGKVRLNDVLNQRAPEVLLLLQGTVDASQGQPSANGIVNDLLTMVRAARSRGARVFVGTLTPQRPGACRGYDFCDGVDDVVRTNTVIRSVLANEPGTTVVDLYQGFAGQTSTLLGLDGLHPNEAGYARIAGLFFDAIRAQLEVSPTAARSHVH